MPTSINDPDYREKVSKLVPCGDFPSETECTQVLDCCYNAELPLNCFKPAKEGKTAKGDGGMSPGGASALTSVSTEKKEVLEYCVTLAQICLHIYQSNKITN